MPFRESRWIQLLCWLRDQTTSRRRRNLCCPHKDLKIPDWGCEEEAGWAERITLSLGFPQKESESMTREKEIRDREKKEKARRKREKRGKEKRKGITRRAAWESLRKAESYQRARKN